MSYRTCARAMAQVRSIVFTRVSVKMHINTTYLDFRESS